LLPGISGPANRFSSPAWTASSAGWNRKFPRWSGLSPLFTAEPVFVGTALGSAAEPQAPTRGTSLDPSATPDTRRSGPVW